MTRPQEYGDTSLAVFYQSGQSLASQTQGEGVGFPSGGAGQPAGSGKDGDHSLQP